MGVLKAIQACAKVNAPAHLSSFDTKLLAGILTEQKQRIAELEANQYTRIAHTNMFQLCHTQPTEFGESEGVMFSAPEDNDVELFIKKEDWYKYQDWLKEQE